MSIHCSIQQVLWIFLLILVLHSSVAVSDAVVTLSLQSDSQDELLVHGVNTPHTLFWHMDRKGQGIEGGMFGIVVVQEYDGNLSNRPLPFSTSLTELDGAITIAFEKAGLCNLKVFDDQLVPGGNQYRRPLGSLDGIRVVDDSSGQDKNSTTTTASKSSSSPVSKSTRLGIILGSVFGAICSAALIAILFILLRRRRLRHRRGSFVNLAHPNTTDPEMSTRQGNVIAPFPLALPANGTTASPIPQYPLPPPPPYAYGTRGSSLPGRKVPIGRPGVLPGHNRSESSTSNSSSSASRPVKN